MRKIFSILAIATAVITFTSCDAHKEFPDTDTKVCHVLCSDGIIMPITDVEKQHKTPVAVVFDINIDDNTSGNGTAVYLYEVTPSAFADSLGVKQSTSADVTKWDGNENTFNMFNCRDVSSPLANSVFELWNNGQSAYIPSVSQMRMLHAAKDFINPILKQCGGDPIPDNPDDCWYWTSTEVSGQELAKAWLYSLSSGSMQETPKTQSHKARAILTLNN